MSIGPTHHIPHVTAALYTKLGDDVSQRAGEIETLVL